MARENSKERELADVYEEVSRELAVRVKGWSVAPTRLPLKESREEVLG